METVTMVIPGMKSSHCQMTVSNAVKSQGGKIKAISPGFVEVTLDNEISRDAVIGAVEKAGYKVTV